MILRLNGTWAVLSNLSHEIGEEGDVNFVKNGNFFSFIFFLGLISPEAVSSDEGDVVVAPSTPRCGREIRARQTECLGKFDLYEFLDDIVTTEKASVQP